MDNDVVEFLRRHRVGVLASVDQHGEPQAATAFYVCDSPGSLVFKSRSASDHMRALFRHPSAALAIYRHDSTYGKKAGVQLKGRVHRILDRGDMENCVNLYSETFDGARAKFAPVEELLEEAANTTLFRFTITEFKFTDGWCRRVDVEYHPWQSQ